MSRVEWRYSPKAKRKPAYYYAFIGHDFKLVVLEPKATDFPERWISRVDSGPSTWVRPGTFRTLDAAKRAAEDALETLLRETGEKLKELREGRE